MSRGPGHIQREILRILGDGGARQVAYIAKRVYGLNLSEDTITPDQMGSVRRALRALAKSGAIEGRRGEDGRNRWTLIDHERVKRMEQRARREASRRRREAVKNIIDAANIAAGDGPKCANCGLPPTPEGHDGCLGTLPGVKFACCGHGREPGYVSFETGHVIRGWFDHVRRRQ